MAESTLNLLTKTLKRLLEVSTFLNLFNNWLLDLKYNFNLLLENMSFLQYHKGPLTQIIKCLLGIIVVFC